jgi:CRP/FNR family transcriptional regulator, cyclic AMP receptor protein
MRALKSHDHNTILKGIPIFASFSNEELSKVEEIISEKSYKKNAVILSEDETKEYMYIVFSGRLKVVQISDEGKEQILVIRKKGDYFGEMSLLDGKTQPATVVAMEDTTVGLISKYDFEIYFLNNENVLKQIIIMLCERLRESWFMQRALSFEDAENRVRAVLSHVSSKYGVKDQRGTIIALKLTHQEIADYSSLARETVSRLLSRFCQSGEIEILDNKNIVLKPSFVCKSLNSFRL